MTNPEAGKYYGNNLSHLRELVAAGQGNPEMIAEIARRDDQGRVDGRLAFLPAARTPGAAVLNANR